MTTQEKRAADLAQKLHDAARAVDTPDRNARSMLTDAAFWTAVATAIIQEFEPKAEPEPVAEEVVEVEAEEVEEPVADDDDDEEKPKKRGRKR